MSDEYYNEETWNMAQAYYKRIDEILTLCRRSYIEDNINIWYKAIVCLFIELEAKMTEAEQKQADELYQNMVNEYNTAQKTKGSVKHTPLVNFERFLRRLMEQKKMLTPKSDDPTKAYRGG